MSAVPPPQQHLESDDQLSAETIERDSKGTVHGNEHSAIGKASTAVTGEGGEADDEVAAAKDNQPATTSTAAPSSSSTTSTKNSPLVKPAIYSGCNVLELVAHGVPVMRRVKDSYVNATQILRVVGMPKTQRTKVLERDVCTGKHEKIQGGYHMFQGTWVPLEVGVKLAKKHHVGEVLKPLFEYEVPAGSTMFKDLAAERKAAKAAGSSSPRPRQSASPGPRSAASLAASRLSSTASWGDAASDDGTNDPQDDDEVTEFKHDHAPHPNRTREARKARNSSMRASTPQIDGDDIGVTDETGQPPDSPLLKDGAAPDSPGRVSTRGRVYRPPRELSPSPGPSGSRSPGRRAGPTGRPVGRPPGSGRGPGRPKGSPNNNGKGRGPSQSPQPPGSPTGLRSHLLLLPYARAGSAPPAPSARGGSPGPVSPIGSGGGGLRYRHVSPSPVGIHNAHWHSPFRPFSSSGLRTVTNAPSPLAASPMGLIPAHSSALGVESHFFLDNNNTNNAAGSGGVVSSRQNHSIMDPYGMLNVVGGYSSSSHNLSNSSDDDWLPGETGSIADQSGLMGSPRGRSLALRMRKMAFQQGRSRTPQPGVHGSWAYPETSSQQQNPPELVPPTRGDRSSSSEVEMVMPPRQRRRPGADAAAFSDELDSSSSSRRFEVGQHTGWDNVEGYAALSDSAAAYDEDSGIRFSPPGGISHKRRRSRLFQPYASGSKSKNKPVPSPVQLGRCEGCCLLMTPLYWRKGAHGRRTLCDPCGLKWCFGKWDGIAPLALAPLPVAVATNSSSGLVKDEAGHSSSQEVKLLETKIAEIERESAELDKVLAQARLEDAATDRAFRRAVVRARQAPASSGSAAGEQHTSHLLAPSSKSGGGTGKRRRSALSAGSTGGPDDELWYSDGEYEDEEWGNQAVISFIDAVKQRQSLPPFK